MSQPSDGDECNRRQTSTRETSEDDAGGPPSTQGAWELGSATLVPVLPVAAFAISGDRAVANAGPAAILSMLLAMAASGLTG